LMRPYGLQVPAKLAVEAVKLVFTFC